MFGAISLVLALRARSQGARVAGVMAMGITMCLLLAPWTYRTTASTGGRFVLITPGTSDSFLRGYVFTRAEFATHAEVAVRLRRERGQRLVSRGFAREAGTEWEQDEVADEATTRAWPRR